jgi:hypothetical protein
MKNLLLSIALLLILSGCSAKTPAGPPDPQFDTTEFNFGIIPANTVVTHVYKLTNAGGDSVVIEDLRAHCGCTKIPLTTSVIGAGKSAPIELRFNSRGYRGKSRKSASVRLDACGNKVSQKIFFTAYTDTAAITFSSGQIAVSEPIVEFVDSVKKIKLEISNRIAASRKLVIVDYQEDRIELSWEKKTLGPKESATLVIERKVPTNKLFASITMEMKGYNNSRITIPVLGKDRKTEKMKSVRKIAPRPSPKTKIPWLDK